MGEGDGTDAVLDSAAAPFLILQPREQMRLCDTALSMVSGWFWGSLGENMKGRKGPGKKGPCGGALFTVKFTVF
eukprot:7378006-Prymnesium_polylepis.1